MDHSVSSAVQTNVSMTNVTGEMAGVWRDVNLDGKDLTV